MFTILLACALIAPGTPSCPGARRQQPIRHDLIGTWLLPTAVLLPPLYALIITFPLVIAELLHHSGLIYRRVFSAALLSLAYGAVSVLAHAVAAPAAGHMIPPRMAPLAWILVTAFCQFLATAGLSAALLLAIKGSSPATRILPLATSRAAARHELVTMALAVIATLTAAECPPLTIAIIPAVIFTTRHLTTPRSRTGAQLTASLGAARPSRRRDDGPPPPRPAHHAQTADPPYPPGALE